MRNAVNPQTTHPPKSSTLSLTEGLVLLVFWYDLIQQQVLSGKMAQIRRSDAIEQSLIRSVLEGRYPPGSTLPLERELAAELGVGRPTLREALQRLERDGWISVKKGRGTLVNDYWRTGTLNILPAVIEHDPSVSTDFIIYLLEIRAALAPAYMRDAIAVAPARVVAALVDYEQLPDDPTEFARFDWKIQMELSSLALNPIYFLLTKSFAAVYPTLAERYFSTAVNRQASKAFYKLLLQAAMSSDAAGAEEIVRRTMEATIPAWKEQTEQRGSA